MIICQVECSPRSLIHFANSFLMIVVYFALLLAGSPDVRADDVRNYIQSAKVRHPGVQPARSIQRNTPEHFLGVDPLASGASQFHRSRLLVRFGAGVTEAERAVVHRAALSRGTLRDFGVEAEQRLVWSRARQLPQAAVAESVAAALSGLVLVEVGVDDLPLSLAVYRGSPHVLYAEPDYALQIDGPGVSGITTGCLLPLASCLSAALVPDDPHLALQWGLINTGQEIFGFPGAAPDPGIAGADLRAAPAWSLFTGDAGLRVAIVDTGIDVDHEDLLPNIWTNPGEIPGNGLDDEGNGWIDDVHGYDFVNEDSDPDDDHGHGTHLAGAIGAVGDNGIGVAGLNWQVQLVALKAFNADGSGFTSDALEAIAYALAHGLTLSNHSWGGAVYSQALYDLMASAPQHLFVAAAGNAAGRNIDTFPHFPASFDLANILTVAATNNDDHLSYVSNIGAVSVDVGCPGHDIYSTLPGNSYGFLTGTSMATAYATGIAALALGRSPALDTAALKHLLTSTSRPVSALRGRCVFEGVLSAAAAVGDCNENAVADSADIASGASVDCDADGLPDECQKDCNHNGVADSCDLLTGGDCNGNQVPDDCDILSGSPDCNGNGQPDDCDLTFSGGGSPDVNFNGIPDECEACATPADCEDGHVCTAHTCVGNLCGATLAEGPCDDGDACTENDRCQLGSCAGDKVQNLACAPRFRLVAVARNGQPLSSGPTGELTLNRGDRVTLHVRTENFAPEDVLAYNALLDDAGYASGSTGRITPLSQPTTDAGAYIDTQRADFIFADRTNLPLVWNDSLDFYQFAALVLFPDDCATEGDQPAYLGTLEMEVSDTAAGDFTFCLNTDVVNASFLLACPIPVNVSTIYDFACMTLHVPLSG